MLRKNLLGAVIIGAAIVGAYGPAYAVPTQTIDGITFPIGIVPGGNQIQSGLLNETLITGANQTLSGIGYVTSIAAGLTEVWGNGDNGVELAYVFSGFLSTSVTAPTSTLAGSADFTGGTVSFYVLPFGTPIGTAGTVSGDISAIEAGTLWLSESAVAQNAAGDTLVSTIPIGSSLSNFSDGFGSTFLDVTGGAAAAAFNTGTFANAFGTSGFSDQYLTSDFSSGSTVPGFGVSGSATLKANASAIPEPISLSLLGMSMLGLGLARRRRS
jgi:hypothetical protein